MKTKLTNYCEPCPECESIAEPYMSTEMYSPSAILAEKNAAPKIKVASLTCQDCEYVVSDESIRLAVTRWNRLSRNNIKNNHIKEPVKCKHCGKTFRWEIHESLDNDTLTEKYAFHTLCCGMTFGPFESEEEMKKEAEKHYKTVYAQKHILKEV